MSDSIFAVLGNQLRSWRSKRGFSQPALARRLGRDRARISELERDLTSERWGRDRLTLFAETCDALDIIPVLVPRGRANEILRMVESPGGGMDFYQPVRSTFDELFIDLSADEENDQ
jgi:transcriptional regulator with XRE-family HTH domain